MLNEFDVRGDTTAILLDSKKYGAMETLIATVDLPRAMELPGKWFPNWHKGTRSFYVRGKLRKPNGEHTSVFLHRWVLGLEDPSICVDHVLQDTLDNCRWSLNVVTQAENAQNNRRSTRNRSGYPGVAWVERLQKWKAHIRVQYELIHLGYFETKEEAIAARRAAEQNLFTYRAKIS